jgi:hypothetical protein
VQGEPGRTLPDGERISGERTARGSARAVVHVPALRHGDDRDHERRERVLRELPRLDRAEHLARRAGRARAVNRPRAIGTYAETAVVRTARTNGFEYADRYALHGALDVGDIGLCPGVIIEVKGGDMAKHATDLDVRTGSTRPPANGTTRTPPSGSWSCSGRTSAP